MIGLIGGSGLYNMEGIVLREKKNISTPFGEPSGPYEIGEFSGVDIIFLPRHGTGHTIPPHRINYRANIWGFKQIGVERIMSVSAAGGLRLRMKPGTITVLDQMIDMTSGREGTFFDGGNGVAHIDFTEPFCPELRKAIISAAKKSGIRINKSGTYVCANGPRLETKAEIGLFAGFGADVVGMTAMPEAALAREAEICYGGIAIVTNYAAGILDKKLTAKEVIEEMNKTAGQVRKLLKAALSSVLSHRGCACSEALREAKV
jgi:5'-methylthioadenosine phosphorylase